MGLESATYIDELVATNPVGATDPKSQGDDHIRLTKGVLQNSLPNISGPVAANDVELSLLQGATGFTGSTGVLVKQTSPTLISPVITGTADVTTLDTDDLVVNDDATITDALTVGGITNLNIAVINGGCNLNSGAQSNTDGTDDLGTTGFRWRRVYTVDARLDDTHVWFDANGNVLRLGGTGQAWTSLEMNEPLTANSEIISSVVVNASSAPLRMVSNSPGLYFTQSNGGDNAKHWRQYVSGEAMFFDCVNDAQNVGNNWLSVTRSAASPLVINFPNGTVQAAGRELGYRTSVPNPQNAGYTFVKDDHGRDVTANTAGNFTVPNSIFAAGDEFGFVNTTGSNCTIVQGAGTTLRLMGASGVTGNRTVANHGAIVIKAQSSSVFLVGGPGCT